MPAEVTVTLVDGLKVGEDVLKDAVLREITAGDIIDAQEESEKLVLTPAGPQLVPSPSLTGLNVLRRQIVRIGNVGGPLDLKMLKRLAPHDLNLLQAEADKLDQAVAAEVSRKTLDSRGRDSGMGG
jgi:phage FluMu protein gp41